MLCDCICITVCVSLPASEVTGKEKEERKNMLQKVRMLNSSFSLGEFWFLAFKSSI